MRRPSPSSRRRSTAAKSRCWRRSGRSRAGTPSPLANGDEPEDGHVGAPAAIDPSYDDVADRLLLGPALASLDERERRLLELRFVDGLSQSEIAVRLGMSQMHVSRLLRRALTQLEDQLHVP